MSFPGKSKDQPDGFEMVRSAMVERLRTHYHIVDDRVLDTMSRIPRHLFVPEALRPQAYKDNALPISGGQTISQPFIVARMTELLELSGSEKVLEIGSGTGYQTAVLANVAKQIFAVERLSDLVNSAIQRLQQVGIRNVKMKTADGTSGWEAYAPYDAILVAAGGPSIPAPLVKQLKVGGRLAIPVGIEPRSQSLIRVTRTASGTVEENFGPCTFVPLIGEFGWK